MPPTRPRSILALFFLAFSASRAAPQGDPGFEPVPAANLFDGTLKVPEENFSVKASGPQWEWLRDTQPAGAIARKYVCRNLRTGERFLLTVFKPARENGEKLVEGILGALQKSQEDQGRQLVGARHEPSEIPAPGSYRLSAMIAGPGSTTYFTAYALPAQRLYVFQHYSEGAKESAVFNAFARSFALTNPVTAAPAKGLVSQAAVGVCVVILVVLSAARAHSRYTRGRRTRAGRRGP